MKKSEIKSIIAAGGGMVVNGEKHSLNELSEMVKSAQALVVVEVPASMTAGEVLRLAKEGNGHVFFTGQRMKEED